MVTEKAVLPGTIKFFLRFLEKLGHPYIIPAHQGTKGSHDKQSVVYNPNACCPGNVNTIFHCLQTFLCICCMPSINPCFQTFDFQD